MINNSTSSLRSSSLNKASGSSLSKKSSNKHKYIAKQKQFQQPKIAKNHSNSRTDRKNTTKDRKTQQTQILKAFQIHKKPMIDQTQCQFSLKLLGSLWSDQSQHSKFKSIWHQRGMTLITYQTFRQLFLKLHSKQTHQYNQDIFNLLSQKQNTINLQSLRSITKSINWQGNIQELISNLADNGNITFELFQKLINVHAVLFEMKK